MSFWIKNSPQPARDVLSSFLRGRSRCSHQHKVCYRKKCRKFTSKLRVASRRCTRRKNQQLQQDQQHDAHFPTLMFRFDVAPHTLSQRAWVCALELSQVCKTFLRATLWATLLQALRFPIELQRKWLWGKTGISAWKDGHIFAHILLRLRFSVRLVAVSRACCWV